MPNSGRLECGKDDDLRCASDMVFFAGKNMEKLPKKKMTKGGFPCACTME